VIRGGVLCHNCEEKAPGIRINDATRYTLQFVVSTPIEKLYTFTVSDQVLDQFRQIMAEYMTRYVHHEFKSLAFISG
jgi:DNA repair protein RecO (recombination protein O)